MAAQSRADVALTLLAALQGSDSGLALDDYEHSLQTATRAERAGADPQLVVAALLHDAGKALTSRRHDRVAAELLTGAVRPQVVWMVRVHQDFAAIELDNGRSRRARYKHVLRPAYKLTKRFVDDWDIPSRDPDYPTLPVEHFAPLVHDVFNRAANGDGPDRWSQRVCAALQLPEPFSTGVERVTLAARRWATASFRR